MSSTDNVSTIDQTLAAFAVGIGIGFGLGILFAPASGRKTRAAIAKRAERSVDEIKDRVEDLQSSASDLLDKGWQTVQEHKDNVARGVDQLKKSYREVVG